MNVTQPVQPVNLLECREAELAEYMEKARPGFTKGALCRGSIYEEIEAARAKAENLGQAPPFDISTTFFPSRGGSSKVAKAKAMCNECPVQWECFEYAYEGHELAGVWGGSSIDDREQCYKEGHDVVMAFVHLFGNGQFRRKFK